MKSVVLFTYIIVYGVCLMVLDALYYSKLQEELKRVIQACYNIKRIFFNFNPYSEDVDSLEFDYLILISVCTVNGKRLIHQDMYPYTDELKAITSITSSKKDAKELVDNFFHELEKIVQYPSFDFSNVIIDLSMKEYYIENLKEVGSKEAISFLKYFISHSPVISSKAILESTILQIEKCTSNAEIISILNSVINLYDDELYQFTEYLTNHMINILEKYLNKDHIFLKRISWANLPLMAFDKVTGFSDNLLTDLLNSSVSSFISIFDFQRQYFIFKLGFIASQSEPDLEKAFETLTNGS